MCGVCMVNIQTKKLSFVIKKGEEIVAQFQISNIEIYLNSMFL